MNVSVQDIQRRLANSRISVDSRRLASMEISAEQALMLKVCAYKQDPIFKSIELQLKIDN